jgi:hypothetical protein
MGVRFLSRCTAGLMRSMGIEPAKKSARDVRAMGSFRVFAEWACASRRMRGLARSFGVDPAKQLARNTRPLFHVAIIFDEQARI